MEQQTCPKLGNECNKALFCHPADYTYMQSTSGEMSRWMNHMLELILPGEISITSDMQMTKPLMAETEEEIRSLLTKSERGV